MEDRTTIVSSFVPLSSSGQPLPDGISRSFAAVYDGHNGAQAADHASSRYYLFCQTNAHLIGSLICSVTGCHGLGLWMHQGSCMLLIGPILLPQICRRAYQQLMESVVPLLMHQIPGCRLHQVLAQDPVLRTCTGASVCPSSFSEMVFPINQNCISDFRGMIQI